MTSMEQSTDIVVKKLLALAEAIHTGKNTWIGDIELSCAPTGSDFRFRYYTLRWTESVEESI